MSRLFWLNDEQSSKIEPLLPHYGSPPRVDDRRILSGIIHVLRCGCRWCDCPSEYGRYTTVCNRFNRWSRKGIWQNIYAALTGDQHTRASWTVLLSSPFSRFYDFSLVRVGFPGIIDAGRDGIFRRG
jgi:transposase